MTPGEAIAVEDGYLRSGGDVRAAAQAGGVTVGAVKVLAAKDGLPDRVAEVRREVESLLVAPVAKILAEEIQAMRAVAERAKVAQGGSGIEPKDVAAFMGREIQARAEVMDRVAAVAMPKAEASPINVNVDNRKQVMNFRPTVSMSLAEIEEETARLKAAMGGADLASDRDPD